MTDELESTVPDDDAVKPAVIVVLEDEKKPEGETVVKTEPKVIIDAAQEGVDALAKNLEDSKKKEETERINRVAAERRATEAEARAANAETNISTQQQQNISANRTAALNAKEAAEARRTQAKKDYISLQAEGKFEEAFEATQVAAQASQEIAHATNYLSQLEQTAERLKNEPPVTQKPQSDSSGSVDPVTGIKFTPKTFEWIKAQGDSWKDQDFRVACDAAARAAKRKGLVADTDEYTAEIDAHLVQMGFKDQTEGDEVQPEPKPKSVVIKKPTGANVSPAPTRAVAGSSGVAKKGVKLSGAEREIAEAIVNSLPDVFKGQNPDQLYARNKQELINEFGEDYGKQVKQ